MFFSRKKSKTKTCASNLDLVFLKELSNGSLIFKIIDYEYNPAGHVVVTRKFDITIIKSGLYTFDKADREHLINQAELFYKAANRF